MPDALGERAGSALAAQLNRRSRVDLYAPVTEGMGHLGVDPTSSPVRTADPADGFVDGLERFVAGETAR